MLFRSVVANNELSSQYTVRGGNFDENLVYVNDIEIYKPFLVKNGQQEGLSFINPDMVDKVEFSSGGWQAKYGDKLSSVLNVRYKTPTANKGSVTLGLLTQSAHAELASKNARLSFVGGIRRKSAQYLLQRTFLTRGFDVQGQYKPRFVDYQGYLNFLNLFLFDLNLFYFCWVKLNRKLTWQPLKKYLRKKSWCRRSN